MDESRLANLKSFSAEALSALRGELVEEAKAKRAGEPTVELAGELAEYTDGIAKIDVELAGRQELADKLAAVDAALAAAEAPVEEPEPEVIEEPVVEAEPAVELEAEVEAEVEVPAEEPEPEVIEEPVVAAAIEPPADAEPAISDKDFTVLTAGADIPGLAAGTTLDTVEALADAMMQRRGTLRGTARTGDGEKAVIATLTRPVPEDRILGSDPIENAARLEAVRGQEALVASGGICAPPERFWEQKVLGDPDRPVRDALPVFVPARGRVSHLPGPVLSDLEGSVRITTAAQDEAGYSDSPTGDEVLPKPCIPVTCPDEITDTIYAVHRCLTFGNFGARTFPEQVAAWLKLSVVQHAKIAEIELLDRIEAESTAVTNDTSTIKYGVVSTFLDQIDRAVAAYRSRYRLTSRVNLHAMFPEWFKASVRADLAKAKFERNLNVSDAEIVGWFRARNVNVSFYLDSATGAGQVFGAQGDGVALLEFPEAIRWYLYEEGAFVFLDGGTLDLGLVRDSTLNSTNDYQIFVEDFEGLMFDGHQALALDSAFCPTGEFAPDGTAIVCAAGS